MSDETINAGTASKKPGSTFIWFLVVFLIALTLRVALLDRMVFSQNELVLVNQALQISQRLSTVTSTVPVYTGLTGLLFFIFGAGDFLAGVVPALVGASMVLLPWAWRNRLGQKTALIFAIALTFDPTFLLFSRAIHGGIFAIAGLLWAFTFLKKNKTILAGLSLSFAFLSGAPFWIFLLVAGLTWVAARLLLPDQVEELFAFQFIDRKEGLLSFGAGFVVSSALILTSFLLNPSGLGGVTSGLIAFILNFSHPFERPAYHLIYLLFAHSLLSLLLFTIGFFRPRSVESRGWYKLAGLSVLIALVLGLIVSRESYETLMWIAFVTWLGGAAWLGKWQFKTQGSWFSSGLIIGFVLAILTYLLINIGRIAGLPFGTPQFWNIFLMIAAGVILLVSAWWLVRFGWSTGDGSQLFLLAILSFIAIVTISSSTRSLYQTQEVRSLEYLDNFLILPNNDIKRVSENFALTGKILEQSGTFELVDLPAEFSWYFRGFFIERNQPGTSVILTRTYSMPDRDDEYRGSSVVLERTINWHRETLSTYLQSLAGSTPAFEDQAGVLWVRTNLFTGASQ